MRIYKDKQYLVFDYEEDGKTVKYDFAKKEAIGLKGSAVKNLKTQLHGITLDYIIEHCSDKNYSNYLKFVKRKYASETSRTITNIGTILSHIEDYPDMEQLFSSGLTNISCDLKYGVKDIPAGLIKICRQHGDEGLFLTNKLVDFYKQNPDAYNIAFSIDFTSITIKDLNNIFQTYSNNWINGRYRDTCYYLNLIDRYGYNAKSLLIYLDHLKTFEAMDGMSELLRELNDYCRIMYNISPKFEKYPKHFLTTHRIATRNYNRLKKEFDSAAFAKRINPEMEYTYKGFKFIYPKSVDEIKDEAVQQNNCVASYIESVINGSCDILFLRDRDMPEKSLVTIEVKNNKICQARQHYNYPCNTSQKEAIDAWNKWYEKKMMKAS